MKKVLSFWETTLRISSNSSSFPSSWKSAITTLSWRTEIVVNHQANRKLIEVFERIANQTKLSVLFTNKLVPYSRKVFSPGRSWTTSMSHILNNVTQAHDDGLVSLVTVFDFTKASHGIPPSSLFTSYDYNTFRTFP